MRKGIPILNRHNEKKYVDAYKPSEVVEYKLSQEELTKYGKPENNRNIPLVINELDWKNTKVLRKKGEKDVALKLITKNIELQGIFKYRLQDGSLSIIEENRAVKLEENKIDQLIEELKQVKEHVKGA